MALTSDYTDIFNRKYQSPTGGILPTNQSNPYQSGTGGSASTVQNYAQPTSTTAPTSGPVFLPPNTIPKSAPVGTGAPPNTPAPPPSTPTYSGNGFDLLKQYQQQNPFTYGQSTATGVVDWLKSQGVNAQYVDHRGKPSADKIWIDGKMYDIIGSSDDPNAAKWATTDVTAQHYGIPTSGGSSAGGSYVGPGGTSGITSGTAGFQQFNVLDQGKYNALYNQLLGRSQQSLQVNPNDPIISGQVDSYRAEQTRGVRDYLAQQAESQGPYSNLNSERRLANEGAAQATGGLQASLIQNELVARRQEIQAALTQMGGMLSDQQRLALQQQLGMIDANLRQQAINSGNDQFLADLGLRAANQANYWNYQYTM